MTLILRLKNILCPAACNGIWWNYCKVAGIAGTKKTFTLSFNVSLIWRLLADTVGCLLAHEYMIAGAILPPRTPLVPSNTYGMYGGYGGYGGANDVDLYRLESLAGSATTSGTKSQTELERVIQEMMQRADEMDKSAANV